MQDIIFPFANRKWICELEWHRWTELKIFICSTTGRDIHINYMTLRIKPHDAQAHLLFYFPLFFSWTQCCLKRQIIISKHESSLIHIPALLGTYHWLLRNEDTWSTVLIKSTSRYHGWTVHLHPNFWIHKSYCFSMQKSTVAASHKGHLALSRMVS